MDTLIPKLRILPVSLPLSAPLKFFFYSLSFFYFLAVLGLHCCTLAFSSCSEWGLGSYCNVQASHCGGFSYWETQALGHLSSRARVLPPFDEAYFLVAAFLVVLVVKDPPANAGDIRDMGSIPGCKDFPRGGHGNVLQYSCLEHPTDRGGWRAVQSIESQSPTQLKLPTCAPIL